MSGKKRAAILPSGTSVPENLRTINTERGTILYDPRKVRGRAIRRAIKFGRLEEMTEDQPSNQVGEEQAEASPAPAKSEFSGLSKLFAAFKEVQP